MADTTSRNCRSRDDDDDTEREEPAGKGLGKSKSKPAVDDSDSEEEEQDEKPKAKQASKGSDKKPQKKPPAPKEEEEDEEEDDGEEEDDEDEDTESDESDEAEEDDEEEEEEEEKPRRKPAAKAPAKKPAKAAKPAAKPVAKPPAKAPEPTWLTPTNVALLLAAAGLGAFWKGWSLYRTDGRDFYSGSAWLFLIAFFLVTLSAFHFLGAQMRPKQGQPQKSLLESLLPALPFFALYVVVWWVAWDTWKAMYGAANNHWMVMFFLALGFFSWGVWYALRPPSEEDIKKDRLPTRRVVLLLMLPFITVYGMIWLAERTPPR